MEQYDIFRGVRNGAPPLRPRPKRRGHGSVAPGDGSAMAQTGHFHRNSTETPPKLDTLETKWNKKMSSICVSH